MKTSPNDKITLYQYWRSSCSWRVRWALNLKETPYKIVSINLKEGEHHDVTWQEQHPGGLLPQVHYQNHTLSQSLAIIEWLEDIFPTPSLFPADVLDRQHTRQLAYTIACDTQPLQNLRMLPKDNNIEYAAKWIHKGLETYQKSLKKASQYSVGDTITLADICLIPQWYNALRFGIKEQDFPLIADIYSRCLETPACLKAHPDNQPDTPLKVDT